MQKANISEKRNIEKIVLMMLDDNIPLETICKHTGLSLDKIKALNSIYDEEILLYDSTTR